jgi:hypothetical protein
VGAAIAVMETSPGDENINDGVKLCLFFNSNIAADLEKKNQDWPNGIKWMPICTQLRGPIPMNTKGILCVAWEHMISLPTMCLLTYHCKPCSPCQSACKHIIVHKPGARKHIICLQASL